MSGAVALGADAVRLSPPSSPLPEGPKPSRRNKRPQRARTAGILRRLWSPPLHGALPVRVPCALSPAAGHPKKDITATIHSARIPFKVSHSPPVRLAPYSLLDRLARVHRPGVATAHPTARRPADNVLLEGLAMPAPIPFASVRVMSVFEGRAALAFVALADRPCNVYAAADVCAVQERTCRHVLAGAHNMSWCAPHVPHHFTRPSSTHPVHTASPPVLQIHFLCSVRHRWPSYRRMLRVRTRPLLSFREHCLVTWRADAHVQMIC
ncbi:hypothetical protein EXIGLDRAFT_172824 [Exidia glandulosa HHB12029]|uniref:Uncharacterized protein n=1 Tax=Exidia glandulosa HHB12029 TaxID=1314781 RepID=A0A165F9G8_EXIGL|nr:hypothetical protein EXIGLDRAFT_172824 [Exidia glandulosa HHB12029]